MSKKASDLSPSDKKGLEFFVNVLLPIIVFIEVVYFVATNHYDHNQPLHESFLLFGTGLGLCAFLVQVPIKPDIKTKFTIVMSMVSLFAISMSAFMWP